MNIYSDRSSQELVNNQLFENKTYYLDFEDAETNEIASEIKVSKLTNFIDWQQGNRFAILCIVNFIGNIYFFGETYDVKSMKFHTELSGTEQFQMILDDIQELSRNIIFSYSSPSFVLRQVNYKDANPTLLLMFNYFKGIILDWDHKTNLDSSISRVINNPNFKHASEYKKKRIEKAKRIDSKTLRLLMSSQKDLVRLMPNQTELINLPITQFISHNTSDSYFPAKVLIKNKYLDYDTHENRFIKFFIGYIESIAYKLNTIRDLPVDIIDEKEQVLSFCRTTLCQPFFRNIGSINMIPMHSTVLQSRAGYRDILQHFTRSRFGVTHLFEGFEEEAMSIDLKRISDLYEYWVFYKIAIAFLGNNIIIEQQDVTLKGENISYGICFKNGSTSVYYNWTESRARNSAYSVTMRPDTTVVIEKDDEIIKFVFDAKYKVRRKNTDEGIERLVKHEDLYKMHAYLDAIKNTVFAIAVYPGTEFYFYEKRMGGSVKSNVSSIDSFNGIGAIPLIPGDNESNAQLVQFVDRLKETYKV